MLKAYFTFLILLIIVLVAMYLYYRYGDEHLNVKSDHSNNHLSDKDQDYRRIITENLLEVSPKRFFQLKNIGVNYDFEGVYILHNRTKDIYYVGQGKHVHQRVTAHFSGRGNGDVYADYKYGDEFTIKMVELENSGYTTLNELERHMIRAYNAYTKGYNKTQGNRG